MPYHLVTPKPFFLFLLLLGGRLLAQDDLVIPDLHGDKESFAKLTDNTLRNELATFIITGTESMKTVPKLNKIPVKETGNFHMIFQKDSVKVIIRTGTFNKSKHKLEYIGTYLTKIDSRSFWGTDGEVPVNSIQSVRAIIGRDTINIPRLAVNDAYNPNLCGADANSQQTDCMTGVYLSNDKKRLYITMLNSDGAGGYEITWIIQNRKYLRRVVDYGF